MKTLLVLLLFITNLHAQNWKIANYFPNIQVITMDPDGDRFKRCEKEFANIGLKPHQYEIVLGIDGKSLPESLWGRMTSTDMIHGECPAEYVVQRKQGRMGCFLTHYNIIKQARDSFHLNKKKYSTVLIIEDNNGFGKVTGPHSADLQNYNKLFKKVMKELPKDWDMLYFKSMKYSENPVTQISPHLAKLTYGVVTKCYAIHSRFYDRVLAAIEKQLQSSNAIEPIDNVIASLHPISNCFVTTPPLTYRVASQSLVYGGKNVNPPAEDWGNWQSDAAK